MKPASEHPCRDKVLRLAHQSGLGLRFLARPKPARNGRTGRDDSRMAVGGRRRVLPRRNPAGRLWDSATGALRSTLLGHTGWVEDCQFAPESDRFATVSADGTVRVWRADTQECVCALRVSAPLIGLSWHPDGKALAVSGEAGLYLLHYLQDELRPL
jgi:hypothetical protein